nr:hypothetical protein [Tanacetum cinerariifolium]
MMHTSKDDYLINTLRFFSAKEATQIYGAILLESLTNHEMKETKAYKTYLGFASGATPPKKNSNIVKRSIKKSTKAPAGGVVIRETPEMPLSKKKEKVDVARGKGIKLLSDVALTEEAQYKEVRRKSLRDFHKTHPSDSGTITKTAPSATKIKPSVTNEGTDVKPGVPDISDKAEGDKDKEINYTTSQLYDDVDIQLNEPVDADEGFIQKSHNIGKKVAELKKDDPLKTQMTALVDEHPDARLGATRDEFMNLFSALITTRITKQVKNQLPQILPEQSSYEAAASLTKFELKKILIDKLDKSDSYLAAPEHRECYEGLIKSYELDKTLFSTYDKVYSLKRSRKYKDKDKDPSAGSDRGLKKRKTSKDAEPTKEFEVADSDMPQDREENPGDNDEESKGKTKAAQYDLPGIEDMVPNIWSPVKVAYDKHALCGISHWRDQRKSFYGYARGLESRHDVYSTKRILAVTRVKEGEFLRLRINDIEDMLILIVQNKLTNLPGDDVPNFTIDLRMFTRSIVIQKQVEDLLLPVESYQKKINVTKLETTKPNIRKKDPYTPYQNPQGFIYVDTIGRNRLMRSNELYKFSDGTLTRLRTSLEDITKNIHMEYLPKRKWSTLEKK